MESGYLLTHSLIKLTNDHQHPLVELRNETEKFYTPYHVLFCSYDLLTETLTEIKTLKER